jgi:hypothetical protein
VLTDPSSDDEGYITGDSDSDGPPLLMAEDEYTARYSRYRRIAWSRPVLLSARLREPRISTTSDDEHHEDSDFLWPPVPLYLTEPRSGGCAPACRCYCNCSQCRMTDGEAVENAWA